jgi:hypothetical protein
LCNLYLMRLLLFIVFMLSINKSCLAQKELSYEEVQYFFSLIKKTINFKELQQKADSFNSDPNNVPQVVKIEILKKSSGAERDDYLFDAVIYRTMNLNITTNG